MNMQQIFKNVGSLNSINQAVRLLQNHGETVVACDNLVITTLNGAFTFTLLANGRIIIK
jgi:hypothetical protein